MVFPENNSIWVRKTGSQCEQTVSNQLGTQVEWENGRRGKHSCFSFQSRESLSCCWPWTPNSMFFGLWNLWVTSDVLYGLLRLNMRLGLMAGLPGPKILLDWASVSFSGSWRLSASVTVWGDPLMHPLLQTYVLLILSPETSTVPVGIICYHVSTQEGNACVC